MRPSTLRRTAVAGLVAVLAVGSLSPAFAKPGKRKGPKPPNPHKTAHAHKTPREVRDDYAPTCQGDPADWQTLNITVNGTPTFGVFAMPKTPAKGIVVFAHGYGHGSASWIKHVSDTAARDGVVAVAMNYRGQAADNLGWHVREGAEDSIAAAQFFNSICNKAKTIVMYGVSMGGNTSGLAVAAQAKRLKLPNQRVADPLFDYWFDIEGAVNVTETYLEARGLALSGNAFAAQAVKDIQAEMGGPIETAHDRYLHETVVNRVDDIVASNANLGVVTVHGVDDGLVGANQTPEIVALLRAHGIKVDSFTALTRGSKSESGTTLDGYVTGNIPGFESPFAGHANEESDTHIVGAAGFERLALLFSRNVTPACRVGVLDGTTGYTQTSPLTSPATC